MDYSSDDVTEFVRLVRDMRAKQKLFFANRSQDSMITAKRAEQQVDGYLNHFSDIAWKPASPPSIQKPLL
jgi:chlorite dismutase